MTRDEYKASRHAYLEDYDLSVKPRLNWYFEAEKLSQEWARLGIRTSILLNGGALILMPTLYSAVASKSLPFVVTSHLGTACGLYVGGLVCAVVCFILAYFNLQFVTARYTAEAHQEIHKINVLYLAPETPWPTRELDQLDGLVGWTDRWVKISAYSAIVFAVASYICFILATLLLII